MEYDLLKHTLEDSVEAAKTGDRAALEAVIASIQDRIYGIAMRMLGHPQDAQDATQEILVKIALSLRSFRQETLFSIWAYRIAINHLITIRKRRNKMSALSFEQFSQFLEAGLLNSSLAPASVDQQLLMEEVKIGCTQGMLLCLNQELRVAYILGEVFEVNSQEGADILDITPEAFRKRLSRARKLLRGFMYKNCGIINPANPCRCHKQVGPAIQAGLIKEDSLMFACHPTRVSSTRTQEVRELEKLDRVAGLYRNHPDYAAPEAFVIAMKELLASRQFALLSSEEENAQVENISS
ncbi:RNA polymerase sigma factor [Ktedonosporobacter rubrisoli]|uniref:RNA polymerase sigma factor n=1 Tax=Ktedonosporobacter rubrisoli TaxID=2509675 RepID=UPI0013EE4E30|nr:RNA polymerase sigma factor [Ktedonosporobacter rubrisoli]